MEVETKYAEELVTKERSACETSRTFRKWRVRYLSKGISTAREHSSSNFCRNKKKDFNDTPNRGMMHREGREGEVIISKIVTEVFNESRKTKWEHDPIPKPFASANPADTNGQNTQEHTHSTLQGILEAAFHEKQKDSQGNAIQMPTFWKLTRKKAAFYPITLQ